MGFIDLSRLNRMCGRFTLTWEEWREISDALCIQESHRSGESAGTVGEPSGRDKPLAA